MTYVWRHDDVGNLFQGQRFLSHQRFFLFRHFLLYNYIIDLLAKHLLNFSWGFQTSEKFRGQNKGNNFPVTSSLSVLLFLIDHGQRPIIALVTLYSPHFITKIISRVCTQPGTFSVRHSSGYLITYELNDSFISLQSVEVVTKLKTFVTFASIDFMPWFEVKLDMHRQQNISAFQNNAACLIVDNWTHWRRPSSGDLFL